MAVNKITDADLAGKGVQGQPDVPGLTAAEMQAKIEEIVRSVAIPKINEIIDGYVSSETLSQVVLASGSVSSVFGRAGAVTAQTGDYTAKMVGAAAKKHAAQHKKNGTDPLSAEDIGAVPGTKTVNGDKTTYEIDGVIKASGLDVSGGTTSVKSPVSGTDAVNLAFAQKTYEAKPEEKSATGAVTVTAENNKEYKFTAVTSLSLTVAATTDCHGFVTFAGGKPTVTIKGYTKTGGDDVTKAAAGETWEFDCLAGYILWKNWGAG